MNIIEMIKEGLRISRTSKALWIFGFFAGLGTGGRNGGKGNVPGVPPAAHLTPHALTAGAVAVGVAILVVLVAGIFMYFVSEGALIEGVRQVRQGKRPTLGEGWRYGRAHWGVLLRVSLIYIGITAASLVGLALPALLALKLSGPTLATVLAIPAVLIAVPWLATLYISRAFAARIAVFENRRALDATAKARLFLHGRLFQGLKLTVASLLGRLLVVIVGALVLVAVVGAAAGVLWVLGITHASAPLVVVGALVLLPAVFVLVAISGMTQSSIWTVGYLTEQRL